MRFEFPTKPTEAVTRDLIPPESWDDWMDEWTPYVYDELSEPKLCEAKAYGLTVRCYPVTRPVTEED